jgi:hypothetical protein
MSEFWMTAFWVGGSVIFGCVVATVFCYFTPEDRRTLPAPPPRRYDARNGRWVLIGPIAKPPYNDHYPDF